MNFNNGTGWHTLTLGVDNYIYIEYDSAGVHPIETRVIQFGTPIKLFC